MSFWSSQYTSGFLVVSKHQRQKRKDSLDLSDFHAEGFHGAVIDSDHEIRKQPINAAASIAPPFFFRVDIDNIDIIDSSAFTLVYH